MPSYTLQLELLGVYMTDMPGFEIWEDGVLDSSYSVSSSGTSISVTINYGGALPSSLEFRFNDALPEAGRTIEVQSVKINDRYVNTGNFLSSDVLTQGGNATVNIAAADFIFDMSAEPDPSEFTTGATRTFTAGADRYFGHTETAPEVFDMLGGNDTAYTGSGDDKVSGGAGNDLVRSNGGDDLLFGDSGNDRLFGGAGNDYIHGGDDNDYLFGNAGDDELHGGAGVDRIYGHADNDILTGGLGNDTLGGGAGDDSLFGDEGDDFLIAGQGNDTIDGGDDNDVAYGGAGDDIIDGGDGNDTLIGNQGLDTIDGGDGDDLIYLFNNDFVAGEVIRGRAGDDDLILANAMTVDLTTGTVETIEDLIGSDADQDVTYTIEQALSFTNINLNGGNDTSRVNITGTVDVTALGTPTVTNVENGYLTGSTGNDDLTITGAQLDTLIFGAGTIDFDTGSDTLNLTSTSTDLNTLGATDASIQGLEVIDASLAGMGIEIDLSGQTEGVVVTGSDVATGTDDIITTGSGDDTIDGGLGDDTIDGGLGDDTIDGGNGRDVILGGAGDDIITDTGGSSSDDTITAGTGMDTTDAGRGDDTINLANGDFAAGESIDGGDDTDELILTNATTVDFTTGTLAGLETLIGSAGSDDVTYTIQQALNFTTINLGGGIDNTRVNISGTLDVTALGTPTVTNAENGFLTGSTGNDDLTITGAQLNALVFGGGVIEFDTGTDVLRLTSTSTTLNTLGATDGSVAGIEEVDLSSAVAPITLDLNGQTEDLIVTGGTAVETITTGSGADTINSDAGADIINSGDGADTIDAGTGNDTINAGDGNDIINNEHGGNDTINGGAGIDTLDFSTETTWVDIDLSILTAQNTRHGTDTISGIENLIGTTGSDDLAGDVNTNDIRGGLANDQIWGNGGADFLYGEAGNDDFHVSGNDGYDDLYDGGDNFDEIQFDADTNFNLASTFVDIERIDMNGFDAYALINDGLDFSGMTAIAIGDIYGDTGNETISGTESNDTVYGLDGTDTLNGNAGNDFLYGGNGNDTINGGVGNDRIYGEAGADILNGDAGSDDFYYGGTEAVGDTVDGGADYDELILTSNLFLDFTTSFTNMERVVFGGFTITANTGTGFDLTGMVRSGASNLYGQGGAETITGTDSDDNIYGLDGNDTLNGGLGADNIYGGEGADILNGGDSNDEFFMSGTESLGDVIDGGAGNDVIRMTADSQFNSANSFTNLTTFDTNGFNILLISGTTIDFSGMNRADGGDIIATAGNETITGFDNADEIYGLAGDDTINGGGGNDLIFGGEGADILNGDAGNDDFRYGGTEALGDTINGGAGSDDLYLTANLSLDFTTSFTSIERVVFNGFNVTANAGTGFDFTGMSRSGAGELLGQNGNETISGTEGGDIIRGFDGNDTLNGNTGSDAIYGGEGADTLNGGNGNDSFYISGTESLGDIYDGGTGTDYIRMTAASSFNSANSFSNIQSIINGGFDQNIVSGATVDFSGMNRSGGGYIVGAAGNETITGYENADLIRAGAGADIVNGGNGNDSFYVSGTDLLGDQYDGGAGNNYIRMEGDSNINSSNVHNNISIWYNNGFDILVENGSTVDFAGIDRNGAGTINGTVGDETITAFDNGGIIYGGGGGDTLIGSNAADFLYSSDVAGNAVDDVATILGANPGVVYNESTGNFYQFIISGATWTASQTLAAATALNGINGHLATVTTLEELNFLDSQVNPTNDGSIGSYWTSGSDIAVTGEYRYTDGPEAGIQFWQGQDTGFAVNGFDDFWAAGQPNSTAQNYVYLWSASDGLADAGNTGFAHTEGYIIEWEGDAVLGTTGTATLNGGDGLDRLYGTDAITDIFVFEDATAYNDIDQIRSFTAADGDALDISDLLTGYVAGTSDINDFITFTNAGANTTVAIDGNGTTGGASFSNIATIYGVNDLDADALLYNSSIIT